ncbi:hypothetical protein LCGC14_2183630 [marine sediment metagenome]|uniref:Adhesin domain-containing protein n=1 Tax=marine sediment metagenome TaxID=412755 RepID=A0A0F9E8L4_9ZZZZ
MANKNILVVFLIAFLGISLIVTIPIFTLSSQLSTYDVMDETDDSFIYAPSNSSPIEKLNIYAERGDVEIKYVSPLVNYFAKIIVIIAMSGEGIAGKSYLDYFSVDWENTSTITTFSMELKSELEQMEVLSLIKNIIIIAYLRADIVFDITVTVIEGNIDLNVPFGVIINNIKLNINTGNIFYDFNYCIIEGNITGIVNEGNIGLKTYNAKYTQKSNWNFTLDAGDLTINISQNRDLGANISGTAKINEGNVLVLYEDNSPNIGARFEIPFGNHTDIDFPQCLYYPGATGWCSNVVGFHYNDPGLDLDLGTVILTSLDLLENRVKNYYDLRFEIFQGSFTMDLTNIN